MLPPPRETGRPYRVALVCLGNICRSPMAHVVLEERLAEAGLADAVEVDSFGTGDWHVGRPMDERAAAALTRAGYDATRHRATQYAAPLIADHDLVLAMDHENAADLRDLGVPEDRLGLFRAFDPEPGDGAVPDPYYGGDDGFTPVLRIVERTAEALVPALRDALRGKASRA